jgi:hypothetical protein
LIAVPIWVWPTISKMARAGTPWAGSSDAHGSRRARHPKFGKSTRVERWQNYSRSSLWAPGLVRREATDGRLAWSRALPGSPEVDAVTSLGHEEDQPISGIDHNLLAGCDSPFSLTLTRA